MLDFRDELGPDQLAYLDLSTARNREAVPDGVVEIRGEPVAYVIDRASRPGGLSLSHIKKTATLRGDAPYLVVLEPGQLTIYDATWGNGPEVTKLETVASAEGRAATTFQRLGLAFSREAATGERGYLRNLLVRLLREAIDTLVSEGLTPDDAVSLAGRVLFTRFLIDRNIISGEHLSEICPSADRAEHLFSGRDNTEATCRWLDMTFNGDLLPLSFSLQRGGFSRLKPEIFPALENILYRSPGGQLLLEWRDLDFAHIPVGLLSQVYERQAQTWDPSGKRRESIYYTPHSIAEYMVQEVFAAMRESYPSPVHQARVLDPAAGGGVFLVAAFQELVAEWWRHQGRRPGTDEIRNILYHQIAGFEINESALRLAALSLYLKAIELDLAPHPPKKLRFAPLRGSVLYQCRLPHEIRAEVVAGSLGPAIGASHNQAYDVVIGNP
ncbi:MAG TPA: N-6 DNA methylase, partial [Thermoanaerobaculia bacterium]|nr:N-6 DNA methylase [Thermoanaerobaculia bacterium]